MGRFSVLKRRKKPKNSFEKQKGWMLRYVHVLYKNCQIKQKDWQNHLVSHISRNSWTKDRQTRHKIPNYASPTNLQSQKLKQKPRGKQKTVISTLAPFSFCLNSTSHNIKKNLFENISFFRILRHSKTIFHDSLILKIFTEHVFPLSTRWEDAHLLRNKKFCCVYNIVSNAKCFFSIPKQIK